MDEFFRALFPFLLAGDSEGYTKGPFVEIRVIKAPQIGASQFFYNTLTNLLIVSKEEMYKGDVYFGVLPRTLRKGDNSAIADTTNVIWQDYDAKGKTKAEVFSQLTDLAPSPQIVVDSGSGYHCYWLLDRYYPFSDAQRVMVAVAAETGGDHVSDKARILRVPGTWNHKTEPPKPVRLLKLDLVSPRPRLSDFEGYFGRIDREPEPDWTRAFDGMVTHGAGALKDGYLPGWLNGLIATDPGKGLRSEHGYHVVASLVELGFSDEDIEKVFVDNPMGVGAKYAEKGTRGQDWLRYTIRSARNKQ